MTGYGSGPYGLGPYGGDTTPGRLPTVHVLLDDGTGAFPYDLTDMGGVSYVLLREGLSLSRGRQDWQGGVTAGSLSLTLNNADGRFTPGSTIIASPSPIKVDQRIRVTETVNGTTFTRFTGYVKQWPVAWPATVSTWATVQVVATDAQARAERRVLRSVIEEEILEDSPTAYYTLGEPAGAAAAGDSSGNQAPTLAQVGTGSGVVFGNATGPGTDGLTAAEFAGGKYLTTTLATGIQAAECYFSTTTTPSVAMTVLSTGSSGGGLNAIVVGSDGKLHTASTPDLVGGPVVTDGTTRHLVWESGHVYLDGVDIGSPTASPGGRPVLNVGGGGLYGASDPTAVAADNFTGTIAHVATYSPAPSGTRAGVHASAGSTGFAGESGTTRLTRLAGYANLPIGTFDTSQTNVAFTDITGKAAWEAIQQVVDAELGIAYFDGSGNLTFHNRNRVTTKTAPDLTIDKSYVTPDVQPIHDDQQIVNYIEATAEGTQVTQVARDTVSELGDATHPTHGRYPSSVSYLVQTDAEALDRANWILANFAEPTTRYGTLTVNLYAMPAATAALALGALEIGGWLQVTDMPTQNTGGATVDLVTEGYSEQVSASSWTLTLNVVSKSLTDALILDDPTRGVLDAGNRLYV